MHSTGYKYIGKKTDSFQWKNTCAKIITQGQIGDLVSQDIITVDTFSDLLIAILGTLSGDVSRM